jgi:hypothetical protein
MPNSCAILPVRVEPHGVTIYAMSPGLSWYRANGAMPIVCRTRLPVDVGESRFEDIADWLPHAAVELN